MFGYTEDSICESISPTQLMQEGRHFGICPPKEQSWEIFCNAGEDWEIILLSRWRLTHDDMTSQKFLETICMSVDEFFLCEDLVLFFQQDEGFMH